MKNGLAGYKHTLIFIHTDRHTYTHAYIHTYTHTASEATAADMARPHPLLGTRDAPSLVDTRDSSVAAARVAEAARESAAARVAEASRESAAAPRALDK
jgi:hypothetical protein